MKQRLSIAFLLMSVMWLVLGLDSANSKKLPGQATRIQTQKERPVFAPGEIRVKFRQAFSHVTMESAAPASGIFSLDAKLMDYGVTSMTKAFYPKSSGQNTHALSKVYTFHFDKTKDPLEVARAFAAEPAVEYAEPIPCHYLDEIPDDPLYGQQEHLPQIYMPQAWEFVKGDSNVIIAVIDGGTDWEHPDLIENIWINEDEHEGDANGDGYPGLAGVDDDGDGGIDLNDVNVMVSDYDNDDVALWGPNEILESTPGAPGGDDDFDDIALAALDDDENGFPDDIRGWDFGEWDNNPTNQPTDLDAYFHGTVTSGLASARTNNKSHVAGVAWNCKIMAIKCGKDAKEYERGIFNSIEAIKYAVDNGADILNLSFGGFYPPSEYERTEGVEYAYSRGALVVASAGNELVSYPHYPSGYPHVLAVTWVYSNDQLTIYTAYGNSVDVAAPGVMLLSLLPDNGTIRMSGSSSATPVVSGLAGLIKSQHPEWGPMELMRQIVLTADNIDAMNPGYEGQLGSGRVNGYRAVTESDPAEVEPKIRLNGNIVFSDSLGGDNDDIFERGEDVVVTIPPYRNYSVSPAENLEFIMTSNDTDITITNGSYTFGYMPPDTTISIPGNFSFMVNANARGKTSEIYIGWQADGGAGYQDTFRVIIGKIPVLIVDDDRGDYAAETMYTTILDDLNMNYAVWDRLNNGPLGPDQLANFPIVIWLCEWAFPALDPDDQVAISNFLDNGGSLFISGQDLGWDFNDPSGYGYAQRDFYKKYLHAIYHADVSPVTDVLGIAGDPIGDGLRFNVYQPGLPIDNQYPDEIEPDSGATSVFEYAGGSHHKFGVKYDGDHKVVYLAMGLEAIDAREFTLPDEYSPTRTDVMKRTIDWLNFIDFEPPTDKEDLNQPVTIAASIPQRVTEDLIALELHWKKDQDAQFTTVAMTPQGGKIYSAEIPGPGSISTINYYFKLVNSYYAWQSPPPYETETYSYYVGPDPNPPMFSHVALPSTINGQKSRSVMVAVSDNSGLDTASVFVHYWTKSVSDSVKLSAGESIGQFLGDLPKFSYGDTVYYYFTASDLSQLKNKGQSETYSFNLGFEDFEYGLDSWASDASGWGLADLYSHSGDYSINNSPGKNPYPNNLNVAITTAFDIDLSHTDNAVLKFWTKVYLEFNHDYGYVEVSADGGATWARLGSAFNGFVTDWKQQTLSLSDYCGAGFDDVRIRFRMVSDATQVPPLPGWFIDDVQIIEGVSIPAEVEQVAGVLPEQFVLHQNYPNPFNPTTTIRFDVPMTTSVNVSIFNVRGELIRTLVAETKPAGAYTIQWNGRDNQGRMVTSGLYFYKLTGPDFSTTRKLLLLK
ncbi:MAG: S8 family serine peptidase [Candidatus Zhuqueibacterota bacterium]